MTNMERYALKQLIDLYMQELILDIVEDYIIDHMKL